MRSENHKRNQPKRPSELDIRIMELREQRHTYVSIGRQLGITKNTVAGILYRINKHFPKLRASDLKKRAEAPVTITAVVKPPVIGPSRPPKWEKEGSALQAMVRSNSQLVGPFERLRPGSGLSWSV